MFKLTSENAFETLTKYYPPDTIDEDIEITEGVVNGLDKKFMETFNPNIKDKVIEYQDILKSLKILRDKYIMLGIKK